MTRHELLRRAVHVGIGLIAYAVPWIGVDAATVLALVAIPANAFVLPRLPVLRDVIRPDGSGTRAIWLYPLAVFVLLVVFREKPEFAQCGWLALGIGDGIAPFIAMVAGGPVWRWNRRKRVLVSVLSAALAGVACLPIGGVRAALAVTLAGTLADSLPLEDNITWPLLGAVAAWTFAATP